MKSFDQLITTIQAAQIEATKVDAGNKAAGTRLRALMQDVKAGATAVRAEVLAARAAGEA
jgi:hypothetical protein